MKRFTLPIALVALAACGSRPDVAGRWEGGFYSTSVRNEPMQCTLGGEMTGVWDIAQDDEGRLEGTLTICDGSWVGYLNGFSSLTGEVEIYVGFASITQVTAYGDALSGQVRGVDASFKLTRSHAATLH
jgi:hypothetical protein